MICRRDSGSSISASAVDPTRSMNKIATFFLASLVLLGALIREPHIAQNRALSAAGARQAGHVISRRPADASSKPPIGHGPIRAHRARPYRHCHVTSNAFYAKSSRVAEIRLG